MKTETCKLFENMQNNLNEADSVENLTKASMKELGIISLGTADEHEEGVLKSRSTYFGYANLKTNTLGDFTVSFDVRTGTPMSDGYPWKFLQEDSEYKLTQEQVDFIEANKEQLAKIIKTVDKKYLHLEVNELTESLEESDDMTAEIYCATLEELKSEVANYGGLYGFVSEKYYTMPIVLLKEIALNALYNLGNDEKVISDIAERVYNEEE